MDFDARTGTGLRQRTVESIGYRIIDSTYPPGHRFANQEDLSAELGVSRTVVREALGLLRDKGLIESRPKAGTVVADHRSWNLLDPDVLRWSIAARSAPTTLSHVAEVRLVIEPQAARLAARRRNDEAAMELLALYDAIQDRDEAEAARAMTELIEVSTSHLLRLLQPLDGDGSSGGATDPDPDR